MTPRDSCCEKSGVCQCRRDWQGSPGCSHQTLGNGPRGPITASAAQIQPGRFLWCAVLMASMLYQGQAQALQQLLDKHAMPEDLRKGRLASSAKDVITYSHKLCYTTFAPPAYQAGVTVLHNFRPPMPQEWQLRASQLHAHRSEL